MLCQGFRAGDPVGVAGFPGAVGQVGAEEDGNGVHHNGGDDLVDLQLHLQHAGDPGVEAAHDHGAHSGHGNGQHRGEAGENHADIGGDDGAQIQLALAAHVENAHPGADGAGKARQAQHHGVFQGVAELALGEDLAQLA